MTTFIKAQLKKSDGKTANVKERVTAHKNSTYRIYLDHEYIVFYK